MKQKPSKNCFELRYSKAWPVKCWWADCREEGCFWLKFHQLPSKKPTGSTFMKYRPEAVCGTPQESLWLPISENGDLVEGFPMSLEECQVECKDLEAKEIPKPT